MRSVGIFEVKTKLSELLRSGEPIEITSHKKSVAVLYPKSAPLSLAQVKRDIKAINQADQQDNSADMGDYV
jgi:antitoxin (DNA-binding transcriptional repressor) of toxin-antitoxin stability system